MTDPRVTVLLAVRNGGAHLREAIDSVLAQTMKDFELLLVDDASTDGAVDALPADSRVRVLRNDRNLGQIPSLNRGLQVARGEYVARMDHDDICLPARLQLQMDILDARRDIALVGSWVDIVESAGRVWFRARPRFASFADFAGQVVAGRTLLVHPSIMFRRNLVLELGGFDERLGAAEDQELYRRLVLARQNAYVVPATLLRYRRHDAQMTNAKAAMVRDNDSQSHIRFLQALAPYLAGEDLHLLLTHDARYWTRPAPQPTLLDEFLDAATRRLALSGSAASQFAATLAGAARSALLTGWAAGAYDRRGQTVARFVMQHGGTRARAVAALHPLFLVSAPVARPVPVIRSVLRRMLRSERLSTARRAARRSGVLRRAYTRLLDARSPDD